MRIIAVLCFLLISFQLVLSFKLITPRTSPRSHRSIISMKKCESAIASIGIKILLSNLLPQINEANFKLIKGIVRDGFIEDENEFFNDAYVTIQDDMDQNENWAEFKQEFETRYKDYVDGESLLGKALLLPNKQIFSSDRWGYDNDGTNGSSKPLDFDLSMDLDIYKGIDKFEVVFILCQESG